MKDEGERMKKSIAKKYKPYPAYVDSGVEWLGEIPEGWTIRSVWSLFDIGRGRVLSSETIFQNQGEFPVYSSQTENQGILGYVDTYDFEGEYLTWTTDGANAGTVFIRSGKFNCTNVCGTLRLRNTDNNFRFLGIVLNIATSWFVRHDINPKLMNNVMAGIRIPIPEKKGQLRIVEYLDRETTKLDALVAKVERAVDLLKEYRIALISAAVTGKIDLREKSA